ncbi:hypothetical protein Dimus_002367 [Dionaea muscipula]
MEGYLGNENENPALLKLLSDNLSLTSSPRSNNSVIGPRYLSSSDDLPLMRYLLSGKLSSGGSTPMSRQFYNSSPSGSGGGISSRRSSPFLAIENMERLSLASHLSPKLKIEEDVLVMDGIMVEPVLHGAPRLRPSATLSDSGGSVSPGSFYKTEICQSWEALGTCQFGFKCQFAHGKEELRPTWLANKSKLELSTGKSYLSAESCARGPRHRFSHKVSTTGPLKEVMGAMTVPISNIPYPAGPIPKHTPAGIHVTPAIIISREWSPLDDGIEVEQMNSAGRPSSKKAVDEHINNALYGPTGRKRLPVFAGICSW